MYAERRYENKDPLPVEVVAVCCLNGHLSQDTAHRLLRGHV
jgi:hypothetical protein